MDARKRLSSVRRGGVRVDWTDRGATGSRSVVGIVEAVRSIALHEPARVAFAAAESARHLGLLSESELRRLVAALPASRRGVLDRAGRASESGGESLAVFELLTRGIPFRQQVRITPVGRVDIVVGRFLVIEIDGAGYHTDVASFEEDRRRDARLSALGYRVLRFSYRQVLERIDEVVAAIEAAISRGDHL